MYTLQKMVKLGWGNALHAIIHRNDKQYRNLTLKEIAALERAYKIMREGPMGTLPDKKEDPKAHAEGKAEIRKGLAAQYKKKKGRASPKSSKDKQSQDDTPQTIDEMLK
jgi:hypothetical protein